MYELLVDFSGVANGPEEESVVPFRSFSTPELARDFLAHINRFNQKNKAFLFSHETKEIHLFGVDGVLRELC